MEGRKEPFIRPKGSRTVLLYCFALSSPWICLHGRTELMRISCLQLSQVSPLNRLQPPKPPTHPIPSTLPTIPTPVQIHWCFSVSPTGFPFSSTLHQIYSSWSFRSQPKATFLEPPFPAMALQSIPASTSASTVLACRPLTSLYCLAWFWSVHYLHSICLKKASFPTKL